MDSPSNQRDYYPFFLMYVKQEESAAPIQNTASIDHGVWHQGIGLIEFVNVSSKQEAIDKREEEMLAHKIVIFVLKGGDHRLVHCDPPGNEIDALVIEPIKDFGEIALWLDSATTSWLNSRKLQSHQIEFKEIKYEKDLNRYPIDDAIIYYIAGAKFGLLARREIIEEFISASIFNENVYFILHAPNNLLTLLNTKNMHKVNSQAINTLNDINTFAARFNQYRSSM